LVYLVLRRDARTSWHLSDASHKHRGLPEKKL
jgi:hypothetical protein